MSGVVDVSNLEIQTPSIAMGKDAGLIITKEKSVKMFGRYGRYDLEIINIPVDVISGNSKYTGNNAKGVYANKQKFILTESGNVNL